jgi:DNA-binding MarR family transcriptional regulator
LCKQIIGVKAVTLSSRVDRDLPFSADEHAAWHGLLQVHAVVVRELDRALVVNHRLQVREFDVLITLFNASEHRLRMSELAERVLLSASGLTRLVDRLERAGLAQRLADPADARSSYTVLTEAGLERLNRARETHNGVIRERMTNHLNREQLRQLGDCWSRIVSNTEGLDRDACSPTPPQLR